MTIEANAWNRNNSSWREFVDSATVTVNVGTNHEVSFDADFSTLLTLAQLASTANGDGASLVGIEDTGTYYSGTDVEAALQEVGASLVGALQVASAAEALAASSTTAAVSPGRQHVHPGHPKCWAVVTVSAGTPTLQDSYNITSITDTGAGLLTITIATDFSTANWACVAAVERTTTTLTVTNLKFVNIRNSGLAAGSVLLECYDGTATTAVQEDPSSWHMIGAGTQ